MLDSDDDEDDDEDDQILDEIAGKSSSVIES